MISRRGVLTGLIAAPLVAKTGILMPLRGDKLPGVVQDIVIPDWCPPGWVPADGWTVSKYQFPELHAWMAKVRQGGAERSANFSLPVSGHNMKWYTSYEASDSLDDRFQVKRRPFDTVTLVSTVPMRRPSGQLCQPGMLCSYQIIPGAVTGAPNRV
jgi:hypothetical protein